MDFSLASASSLLKGLVQTNPGLALNAVKDTAKLVLIGSAVETTRRLASNGWNQFIDSFYLTAHFSQEDFPYDWLMHWLSKQPAWSRSREFEITTRSTSRRGMSSPEAEDEDDEDDDDDRAVISGSSKKKVAFMPSHDTTHTIFFGGHWLKITRGKRTQGPMDYYSNSETLKISVIARNNEVIKKLVLQAKREYERDAEHRVHIFLADVYGRWGWNGARHKRPMSSIVLEPGVKNMLLEDAKDFLRSEDWYAERGIPFRRGYLLHGVPGSGKTSLIHAIAGELGLDIYVVTLSSKGMNDTSLASLMGRVPTRCILLLEDLDAAFTRSTTRDSKSTGSPSTAAATDAQDDGNTLSLSGLLNSLDGVAAAEGRLLFATTNHIDRLDPALSRPGRMDVWVHFTNASKWQAEALYKCFFPVAPSKSGNTDNTESKEVSSFLSHAPPITRRKTRRAPTHSAPVLTEEEITTLATAFAEIIPDGEMSVASLQGYLLKNKCRPHEAVSEAAAWVVAERELKDKLRKEKEEKEAEEKAKLEAKEKEDKDKLEKEKKDLQRKEKKAKRAKAARRAARRAANEVVTDSSDSDYDEPVPKATNAAAADAVPPAVVATPVAPAALTASDAAAADLVSALVDAATTSSSAADAPAALAESSASAEAESVSCEEGDKLGESTTGGECEECKSEKWLAVDTPASTS